MLRKEDREGFRATGESVSHHRKSVHAPEGAILPGKLVAHPLRWWENPQALRRVAEGAVFIFLVLIIGIFGSQIYLGTTETARRRVCAANLRQIGLALQMYMNDYDGLVPPSGGDFVWQTYRYLPGIRYVICPSDEQVEPTPRRGQRPRVAISYTYQAPPGLRLDLLPNPASFPTAWDRNGGVPTGAHRQGGNVLYADGHTRWRPMHLWSGADLPTE